MQIESSLCLSLVALEFRLSKFTGYIWFKQPAAQPSPGPLHGRGHRKRLLTKPRQGKACKFSPALFTDQLSASQQIPETPQNGSNAVSVKDFSEVHQINHPPNLTQQPPWQAHLAGHPLCFNQHFHLSFHGWCFSTRRLNQTRRSNHETAPLPTPRLVRSTNLQNKHLRRW